MVALLAGLPALLGLARRAAPRLASGLALLLVLGTAVASVPRALRAREALARTDAEFRAAWRSIPANRGIVLWADDHYQRFVLLQLLERQRPEIYVDNPEMLIWPLRRRAFQARFGFDPLEGLDLRTPADLALIPGNVERRAPVRTSVLQESGPR
jgi:hypothetical protein